MSSTPAEEYELSTTAAASYLGVHRDTLLRWVEAGKVSAWRTPGGRHRFRRSDLEALLPATAPSEKAAS